MFISVHLYLFNEVHYIFKFLFVCSFKRNCKFANNTLAVSGLPMAVLALFYAVTYNVYKYTTNLPVDYIYGDVNYSGDV